MSVSDSQLEHLAEAVGTPAYVYDAEVLRQGVRRLRQVIPGVEFAYSLKANPNISIVKTLTAEGVGTEVCSLFELEACLAAAVDPRSIIFVGPAKSRAEIDRAVSRGLKAIIAESLDELAQIENSAKQFGVVQAVALRINPSFHTQGARLAMSGRATQFGIDQEQVDEALRYVGGAPHLRLAGIHVYMGTRILDHRVVIENSRQILSLAAEIATRSGTDLDFVDIGGGFGIAYSADEPDLDLAALGAGLTSLVDEFRSSRQTKVLIELGRYMVANAGTFVTRVRYVKRSKGRRFAICDGGTNCHLAAGQAAAFRKNFPVSAVAPRTGADEPWTVSGPLCTPTDVIAQDVAMPALRPGDLIRIERSGAYGPTASPVNFLSFCAPVEVMIDGEATTVIRERTTLSDYINAQVPRTIVKPGKDRRQLREAY